MVARGFIVYSPLRPPSRTPKARAMVREANSPHTSSHLALNGAAPGPDRLPTWMPGGTCEGEGLPHKGAAKCHRFPVVAHPRGCLFLAYVKVAPAHSISYAPMRILRSKSTTPVAAVKRASA